MNNAKENNLQLSSILFVSFYAEDTVIMAESNLQNALNYFETLFELEVNFDMNKTPKLTFSKVPMPKKPFYVKVKLIQNVREIQLFVHYQVLFAKQTKETLT